jgi:tellurite resistance protein
MNAEAPEIKNFLMLGTNEEKHQALRLLVMVTAADGNLDQAELKFAVEMGAKLGFTQADVAQVYQGMRGKADTQV